MLSNYQTDSFYDEMFATALEARQPWQALKRRLDRMSPGELRYRKKSAEKTLISMGITFTVNSEADQERILPFDIIPRIIANQEWQRLEQGLKQRIIALNAFIEDVYNKASIIKDGVVPAEVIFSSKDYLEACRDFSPPRGIWAHISGTDLIRGSDGQFMVLEDNLRCPSGVSYVLENREVMKRIFPEVFNSSHIKPVYDYTIQLRKLLDYIAGLNESQAAVWTPGVYNSAYYEHSFLAQRMGIPLVEGNDLVVENDRVYMKTTHGLQQVISLYRRINDSYMDPAVFHPESLLGVRGIFSAWRKGNVALANAPGTGVADDKVIYAYVPEIIRYYLGEDAILPNVPTWLCSRPKDQQHVLSNIENLVVKAANGAGGYDMIIGPAASQGELADFRNRIKQEPRNYIAQPVISLSRVPTMIEDRIEGRHVDLRPFILYNDSEPYVMPGGLTRVALRKGSLVVNSSQGGGSKDTWVLEAE
ncbi:MAG: circularly permuted type 2 ATP-grasp protein [Leptospiraceae bacterium]|nr:circularly permuted type 2 ATP-grasp protein [Leptospiraceae bacterium]